MAKEHHLTLTKTGFAIKDHHYNYDDVEHIYFHYLQERKSISFRHVGTDHYVDVQLYMKGSPRPVIIQTGAPFIGFTRASYGEVDSLNLIHKLSEIQRHSAQHRLQGYLGSLKRSGYFHYDGKKIEANGNVHYPGRVIPLRGDVPIFKGPFYVYHEVKGGRLFGLFNKRYYLNTTTDADVFFFILDKLFNLRWK